MKILFVDDEPAYCRSFKAALKRQYPTFEVQTASDGREALSLLQHYAAEIVFSDFLMPRLDGLGLLKKIRETYPHIFVLMLTGVDSTPDAVTAMKAGAYDYILKPFDYAMVFNAIDRICEHKAVLASGGEQAEQGGQTTFESIVGQDAKMFELYERIKQVAQSNASVLITGESGTGKELIAEAIHNKSVRKGRTFIQVNCASLTESLINSELFGHEKGAFTGSTGRRKGFFEQANGGTIFLDEIGDIPLQTQVALLRVLELGTFQRVGGTETIHVDVRLICATNRNLQEAIQEKLFREDLYYRINVVSLRSPSLHERKSDIPLLANYFLRKYCATNNKQIKEIAKTTIDQLTDYPWPGNVRELANAIEHAVVFCQGNKLVPGHLPAEICDTDQNQHFHLDLPTESLAIVESSLIRHVLEKKNWNLKQAADTLEIARGTLYSKMEKYQISKPD